MQDLFSAMAARAPSGDRHEEGPLLLLSTGAAIPFFNPTFLTGPVPDAEGVVGRVRDHYAARGLPFVLLFRDDLAPALAAACEAAGMVEHWKLPLMALDPIPPDHGAAGVPGLEVRRVAPEDLDPYNEVLGTVFGMPRDFLDVLGTAMFAIDGFWGLLGLLDGVPVATSAVFLTGRTAGVFNVATVESHRRRGLGEALTAAAARLGREAGADHAVLQSSEAGQPVYQRMGYDTLLRYRQFEAPAPTG